VPFARRLTEEYTPIWVALAVVVSITGMNLEILRGVANLIGAWTLSSTVFFLGQLALGAICLHHAIRLSASGRQIKVLLQDVALLRARVDELSVPPEP